MNLFGKIKNQAAGAVGAAGKSVSIVFPVLPQTQMEFTALPQAALQTPFDTAALFLAALCVYPKNKDESIAMINFLKGPQPLSTYDVQFIADRMRGKDYLPASFFAGATPANNYAPTQPYTIVVSENAYSYEAAGYAKLAIQSSGADSPRPIKLRQAKDSRWYLWGQHLLSDIRPPGTQTVI